MGSESPVVVLFDMLGNEMPVQNGAAIPSSTPALLVAGSDGTDSRYLTVDTSGRLVVVGAGTAGTSTGGVLTVQGVSGGTNLPVSQGTTPWTVQGDAANGSAVAGNPVLIGGSDGTDARTVATDSSGRQIIIGAAASGSAVTGNPVLIGGSDGTDARTLSTDTSGHAIIVGDGTAGTPAGGVVTVQGVSGGTNLPVSQGTSPWVDNLTQIAGNAVVTAASGVLKVGIVGNAGATLDATLTAGTAPTDGLGTLAQYNTTQPAPTNSQTLSLQSDQSGNLLEFPGVQTKTGSAWTTSTTINTLQYPTGTTTVGAPLGAPAILIQLDQTTTLTGGAVTFQGTYDGTNWVTIPTAQVLNPQTFAQLTNPYSFVASTNQPFLILIQGFQQIRLNLTTTISGSGSVTPYWTVLTGSPLAGSNQVQGMAATGAAPVGNPVFVGGENPSSDVAPFITDAVGSLIASVGANKYVVQSNSTVTTSSSTTITTNDYGTQQVTLIVNITTAPTGTTPTLSYTIQEVDPGNGTTTYGNTSYTGSITTTGVYTAVLTPTTSSVFKVTWTVTGTTPSFTGVYTTLVSKSTPAVPSTYSASFRSITPAATATDIFTITGSASRVIRVLRMNFSAIQTTAASQELLIIYRTTANSGGTSTTGTNVPWDPINVTGTATVRAYTANPTSLGTSAGNLQIIKYFVNAGGSGTPEDYTFDFTHNGTETGIVLRGTGDTLSLNWNGAAVPAGLNVDFFVVWTEE